MITDGLNPLTFLVFVALVLGSGAVALLVVFSLVLKRPDAARLIAKLGFVGVSAYAALFLLFVVVQLRYFFGGAELVQRTTGLTHAQYARQGFFQLVAASALVLPVLLGADWTLRRETPAHQRAFRSGATKHRPTPCSASSSRANRTRRTSCSTCPPTHETRG